MALIGFARVSSVQQDLTLQLDKLEKAGCEKIFSGKHSGKEETNKQKLEELLNYVREGDVVVVTKLDRLGRSLKQVLTVLDRLKEKNVGFKALEQPIDTTKDNDPISIAMIQLLGLFAEMERNFIVSRTSEGRLNKGVKGGRKPLSPEIRAKIVKETRKGDSASVIAKRYGVTPRTVYRVRAESKK